MYHYGLQFGNVLTQSEVRQRMRIGYSSVMFSVEVNFGNEVTQGIIRSVLREGLFCQAIQTKNISAMSKDRVQFGNVLT